MTASVWTACVALLLIAPARAAAQVGAALDAFERSDWVHVNAPPLPPEDLLATLKALKHGAPEWIAATGPRDEPRRRLLVATYVLHLLASQEDPLLWQGGGSPFHYQRSLPAIELLEWACRFLRDEPQAVTERWWHLGAIALLERHGAAQALILHLDHAHGRFPGEDRWVLGRAIAEELRTWPEARDARPLILAPEVTAAVVGRYEEAAARDSIRAEAWIRLGYFELRRHRPDAALLRFRQAGTPVEPALRYWQSLFAGQALERAQRAPEAIDAYRAALDAAPDAQSAALALAGALVAARRDSEAWTLVQRVLAVQPASHDPWADYVQPDWRFWDRVKTELRKAVAP